MDDTRDIVIETRANVAALVRKFDDFVQETRDHRAAQDERLASHEALVNRAKGAKWVVITAASAISYISSYLPHPKF